MDQAPRLLPHLRMQLLTHLRATHATLPPIRTDGYFDVMCRGMHPHHLAANQVRHNSKCCIFQQRLLKNALEPASWSEEFSMYRRLMMHHA